MKLIAACLVVAATVSTAIACGGSDAGGNGGAVGSACGQSGATEPCASGAICGKPSDGTTNLQCLVACKEQTDCPSGQDCNGVDGSALKGCRPRSAIDAGKK